MTIRTHTLRTPLPQHHHAWIVESSHGTSAGTLRYVRCSGCHARSIELLPVEPLPTPLTHVMGAARSASPRAR